MSGTDVTLDRLLKAVVLLAAATAPAQQPGESPANLFKQGAEALQLGSLSEAEVSFRAVTQQDPTSAAAFVNLGVTLMRERHWAEALMPLRRAEQLEPSMAGVHLDLGLVHFQTGAYAEALPEFRDALERTPANVQARYLLGLSCFFTGDYQRASETLLPLWSNQSANLTYLYVLGSAAGKARLPDLEARALGQMALVGEGSPEFYLYAGKAMLGKQEYAKAVIALQHAITQQPSLPMAHFFLAQAYDAQHQEEQARTELETEIRLEPDVAYGYDELGRICLLLGNDAEAETAYRGAIARDPSLTEAYVGLASLYKRQGSLAASLAMIDHAVTLRGASGSIHYLRAQILKKMHRDTEARTEFTTSATLLRQFNDTLQHGSDAARDAEVAQIRSAAQL